MQDELTFVSAHAYVTRVLHLKQEFHDQLVRKTD